MQPMVNVLCRTICHFHSTIFTILSSSQYHYSGLCAFMNHDTTVAYSTPVVYSTPVSFQCAVVQAVYMWFCIASTVAFTLMNMLENPQENENKQKHIFLFYFA